MRPFHQLLSPPPSDSDREASVSSSPHLSGNMPLDYAIETDVKPIIRDFRTGAVLDPGGAGDKYVVDHRGKRVPYEILPDRTPSPVPKRDRIKSEPAPCDRLQTGDIKSEDEDDGPNRTQTAGTRDPRQGGSSHRHAATATAPSRPRIPCLSTRGGDRKPQTRDSPSEDDDNSSDDTSSSSRSSSSDESSSEDSDSSDDSDSCSSMNDSAVDVSSVFRPSKSPSRFADTPSPTTRSQSHVKKDKDSDSGAPSTPSPPSKKKKKMNDKNEKDQQQQAVQAMSIQRPPSLSFYIPIRQTDCQSRPNRISRLPSRPPAPERIEATIPTTSRGRGCDPVDKSKKTSKSSKSSDKSADGKPESKDVRPASTAPAAVTTSQHYRAATAGPSTAPQTSGAVGNSFIHSQQKIAQSQIAQSSQSQSSSVLRSPKGKQSAAVGNDNSAGKHKKKRFSNKKKWKKLKDKTKAKKKVRQQQEVNLQAEISNRHGPPRQARIERSIESPGLSLPTPDPSSSLGNIIADSPPNHSPARSESGKFVTSPIRSPTTPGHSSHRTPPASPNPMHSSLPTVVQSKKRSRSVYEDAFENGIRTLKEFAQRCERVTRDMQTNMNRTREALEQKTEQERMERQLLEQRWEEQFHRVRNDDRTERERVALELERRLCRHKEENQAERKRIEQALVKNETRLTTLHGQVQSQSERMESRMDGQASQLSAELDGLRARNHTILMRLETYTRKQEELKKRFDEAERQGKLNQYHVNDRLLRLETASLRADPAATSTQGPAQLRTSGAQRPYIRYEPDWSMRGRQPGVLSDTLIRSEHGKPNPRALPPRLPRTPGGSVCSSSASRPAQQLVRNSNAPGSNRSVQTPGASGSSSSRSAQQIARNSNTSDWNKPNKGALRQNSSSNIRPAINTHSASREQSEPPASSVRPSPKTTNTRSESRVQPTSSPVQRALIQSLPEINPQPAPATPSSSAAAAANEPNASPPGLPRLTHEKMKDLVFNYPLSELEFTIDCDEDTEGSQMSAATVFLLNAPQLLIETRFRAFIKRPAFAFDLDNPATRAKGCWAVQAGGQKDTQFKLYYDEGNYAFTMSRVAVRLWHGEDSVLRFLLSKYHKAVHLCHQTNCFNPEHIVVESRKEQVDRSKCLRDGWCHGHRVWSKCGPVTERRRCILS